MASIKQLTILTCSIRWRTIQLQIKCKFISQLERLHLDCINVPCSYHMNPSHNTYASERARNTQFTTTVCGCCMGFIGRTNWKKKKEEKNEIEYVLAHAFIVLHSVSNRNEEKNKTKQLESVHSAAMVIAININLISSFVSNFCIWNWNAEQCTAFRPILFALGITISHCAYFLFLCIHRRPSLYIWYFCFAFAIL